MTIRQEEQSPIGNFFHDRGLHANFRAIEDAVDDFEIDTEKLKTWIDSEITKLKDLKNFIMKAEKEWQKRIHVDELEDSIYGN